MRYLWVGLCVLALAGSALAAPPVVGPGCVSSWTPVMTNVGGSPVVGTISYNVYVYTTTPPVKGVTPPTLSTSATSGVKVCPGLTPGVTYNEVVTAVETFAPGDVSEGAYSAPFAFTCDAPAIVSGNSVQ